jgi:hypothetical protein
MGLQGQLIKLTVTEPPVYPGNPLHCQLHKFLSTLPSQQRPHPTGRARSAIRRRSASTGKVPNEPPIGAGGPIATSANRITGIVMPHDGINWTFRRSQGLAADRNPPTPR